MDQAEDVHVGKHICLESHGVEVGDESVPRKGESDRTAEGL